MTQLRNAPSGRLLEVLQSAPIVRVEGYTASAPLTLTLQPAGHERGLYLLSFSAFVRAVATAGTIARGYSYFAPDFGLTSIGTFSGSAITAAAGLPGISTGGLTEITCYSSGAGPITATFTPAGVTGSPLIDVSGQALLIGF